MTDPGLPQRSDADSKAVVAGNTAFALDLYQQLCRQEGNLFFSPYSISTALAMTYAGARGDTEAQMAQALHFGLGQDALHPAFAALQDRLNAVQAGGDVQLSVANALWPHVDCPFVDAFLDLVKVYYGVSLTTLDCSDPEAARQHINAWAEEQTRGKIKDLIPKGILNVLTRLVLTNAIYFKGNWASQFDKARTKDAPFTVQPGQQVTVPLMTQKLTCGYGEFPELQVLELPYMGDGLSMLVLLPRQVDGLASLEAQLTPGTLAQWTARLRQSEVQIYLPRFRVEAAFRLDDALKALGMVDAFDMDLANFAGMDGTDLLSISAVLHKSFVEVNEEGTEAAAATAVVMTKRAMPLPQPVFRADHPFLILIRENSSGSVLFLGRVVDPRAET
ncbi:MAG TPA: serpin family protein [Anaerolineae bacterium]|nr:serpin family protein [Anaerolineae bacterium]